MICSDTKDKEAHINRMFTKFVNSGFKEAELEQARGKALALSREEVLQEINSEKNENSGSIGLLTFVINQDAGLKHELNSFFKKYESQLKSLLGNIKIMVSERRHANTTSLLFQKSSFSQKPRTLKPTQQCKAVKCKTKMTMNLHTLVWINGVKVKLDMSSDCSTKSVIYIGICRLCNDHENKSNFYIGQTVNSLMDRNNGHRSCFTYNNKDKSALSLHIFDKHPESIQYKLENFNFGICKAVNSMKLDRTEDFYIYKTKADTEGLNRYKVLR